MQHPDSYDLDQFYSLEKELKLEEGSLMSPVFGPLRFAWIFATSRQIKEMIRSVERRADECDFEMIQISQVVDDLVLNLFHSPHLVFRFSWKRSLNAVHDFLSAFVQEATEFVPFSLMDNGFALLHRDGIGLLLVNFIRRVPKIGENETILPAG